MCVLYHIKGSSEPLCLVLFIAPPAEPGTAKGKQMVEKASAMKHSVNENQAGIARVAVLVAAALLAVAVILLVVRIVSDDSGSDPEPEPASKVSTEKPEQLDDTYVEHRGTHHPHLHLNLYFADTYIDEGCTDVAPVATKAPTKKTDAIEVVVDELVRRGPSRWVQTYKRLTTAIPEGTKVNSLTVEDGVATIDFNARVEAHNNTCYNELIRAQVGKTLTQFDEVSRVVFSVEGETEDVLPVEASGNSETEEKEAKK